MTIGPQFPVYIPSKSRAAIATTPRVLDVLGVDYRLVVEEAQADEYRRAFDPDRVLVLDPTFQRDYDTFDDLGDTKSRGPGPARNFAWEHARSEGATWHWVMDDNIRLFARFDQNRRIPVGDGAMFAAMETFALRYRNLAMVGPEYWMFQRSRERVRPFRLNTRIFSCNLIRNDVRQRWRGRYNEDLDLSISVLKAGWTTVLFQTFLQWKTPTQVMPGGNTEAFYAEEGTTAKSRMAVAMHPDVCRLAYRWGRAHHVADFARWKDRPLVRRSAEEIPTDPIYREKREAR